MDSEPEEYHDIEQERPHKKRRKYIAKACNECKRRKIKCNGQTPCQRCGRQRIECVYADNPRASGDVHKCPPCNSKSPSSPPPSIP